MAAAARDTHGLARLVALGRCVAVLLVITAATMGGPGWAAAVYQLEVAGLACPFCAYGIEKELRAIDGVAAVETRIEAATVRVRMREGATLDRATAKKAVRSAGFSLRGFSSAEDRE